MTKAKQHELNYKRNGDISNRKDHFIPQFLLRNFAIEEADKNPGLVYIYKKFSKNSTKGSIAKHAGNETDFYLGKHTATKELDKSCDDVYKEIEKSKYAPSVIKKVLEQDGEISLKYEEESVLATLVAHQFTRTRKFRKTINKFLSFLLLNNFITKDDLGDKEKIQEVIVKNKFNISPKQIKSNYLLNYFSLSGIRGQELLVAIQIAESIVEEIYQKNLHTIITPENHYFILSDAPVCIIGKNDELIEVNNFWSFKRDDGYSFILPISPKKAIVFGNNFKQYGQITDISLAKSLVVMVNSLSVNNFNEEFYSHTDSFWSDYKNDLITPARLSIHRKISQEIQNNLFKRVKFFAKYGVWKLKKFLER